MRTQGDVYVSLKGNHQARANLYKSILDAAKAREDELRSHKWDVNVIFRRLKNEVQKDNYPRFP